MTLQGKGFFIWKINYCDGGDPERIANLAKDADLSHVLIKVANGIYSYNYNWDLMVDLVPPVANALQSLGIKVWGWHYVYGDDPINEARIAIRRVQDLNLRWVCYRCRGRIQRIWQNYRCTAIHG